MHWICNQKNNKNALNQPSSWTRCDFWNVFNFYYYDAFDSYIKTPVTAKTCIFIRCVV